MTFPAATCLLNDVMFRCSLRPDLGYVQGLFARAICLSGPCIVLAPLLTLCRNVLHRHDDADEHGRVRSFCELGQHAAETILRAFHRHGRFCNVAALALRLHLAPARDAHFKRSFHGAHTFHRIVFDELVNIAPPLQHQVTCSNHTLQVLHLVC